MAKGKKNAGAGSAQQGSKKQGSDNKNKKASTTSSTTAVAAATSSSSASATSTTSTTSPDIAEQITNSLVKFFEFCDRSAQSELYNLPSKAINFKQETKVEWLCLKERKIVKKTKQGAEYDTSTRSPLPWFKDA
ncbi:unnamed protein product, partial [Amoebophrya sp. A120]|eukprot:GSA120T00006865001.1